MFKVATHSTFRESKQRSMPIYIKDLTGKTTLLNVEANFTVEYVKYMLYEIEGMHIEDQRLIYAGRQLEEGRTLKTTAYKKSLLYM
jgi:large subunit ribosomal protein L40e